MEAHIYIYGIICSELNKAQARVEFGKNAPLVSQDDVALQLREAGRFEELNVHIRTEGGEIEEGMGIYDLLRAQAEKGVQVKTIAEGVLKSMGTTIFLAGDTREMTPNTRPYFHLPLLPNTSGNARDLESQASYLRELEMRAARLYSERMGISIQQAIQLMEADADISYEKALELNFITQQETKLKAVAFVSNVKPNNQMAVAKEIEEAIQKETNGLFEKIQNLFKSAKKPMNIVIQDANGVSLDFADVEDREPEVGDMATVEGAPAEGEYVMPDGRTLVFAAGSLTEIKEAEPEESEEMEQMRAENETLKAENAQLKAGLDEVKNQFTQLKASMTSAGIQFGKPKAKGTQHKQETTEPTNRAAGLKDRLNK